MTISLFANYLPGLVRLARMHDGRIEQLSLHPVGEVPLGSYLMARVVSVHQGMQAAFLDIGGEANVFLDRRDLPRSMLPSRKTPIESVLSEGRAMLVQLTRHPFGGKLAQVKAELSFVGFYAIYLPQGDRIVFAKEHQGDQQPIRALLKAHPGGWIVRSAATGIDPARVAAEAELSIAHWQRIQAAEDSGKPRLIEAADPLLEAVRDRGPTRLDNIYVDDIEAHERLQAILAVTAPELAAKLRLHTGDYPLFDVFKVTDELERLRATKVNLKSGGWLHFQKTEAMTVIDVNTGKIAKSRGGLSPALRTDLEAVPAIARHVRARNLGGLVAVDFINAAEADWRERIDKALKEAIAADPARVELLPLNAFGIAHISRERVAADLAELTTDRCFSCKGEGRIPSFDAQVAEIQVAIIRQAPGMAGETFRIACHKALADFLTRRHALCFMPLEHRFEVKIQIKAMSGLKTHYSVDLG